MQIGSSSSLFIIGLSMFVSVRVIFACFGMLEMCWILLVFDDAEICRQ